jgi:hypothetical protein
MLRERDCGVNGGRFRLAGIVADATGGRSQDPISIRTGRASRFRALVSTAWPVALRK